MPLTRRTLLATGGLTGLAVLAGAGWWITTGADRLEFTPLSRPEGFRSLGGGPSSTGFDPLTGLGGDRQDAEPDVLSSPCEALFAGLDARPGVVRIASFSDYNCPYCRTLTDILSGLEDTSDGAVRVVWHELPLLGQSSGIAARGALAAGFQDAYLPFHKRLMSARFHLTPEYLVAIAGEIGLDPEQFQQDMAGERVTRQLATSRALARLFGFIGTPALVVERTAVLGEIPKRRLTALIDRERADGPAGPCS